MKAIRIVLLLSLVIVANALANDEPRHRAFDVLPSGRLEMSLFRTTLEPHVSDIVDRLYAHVADQRDWMSEYVRENGDFEPGEGLPYHDNFGITEEEYKTFLNGRLSVPIRRIALTFSKEDNIYTIAAPEGDEFGNVRIDMQSAIVHTEFGLTAQCELGYPDIFPRDSDVLGWYGATCIANDGSQSDGGEKSLHFSIGKTSNDRLMIIYQARIVVGGESIRNLNLRLYSVDAF